MCCRAPRLPLDLLEGAPRRQRALRWRVLRRRIGGITSMLTYGCLQFELALFLSVWLFALLLIPHEWRPQSLTALLQDDVPRASAGWTLAGASVAYLATSAIEPLYVACGFALYLNRRTQLEAWDIDLAFRRLRARLQGLGKLLGVLLLCAGTLPLSARAATATVDTAKPATSNLDQVFGAPAGADRRFAAAAAEVYRDPRFGGERTVRRWSFKYEPEPSARAQPLAFPLLARVLAAVFKGLLWLGLIGAVGALAWFAWRWHRQRVPAIDEASPAPLHGLANIEAPAPLPADLAAATRALWQAQHRREALALLYRGCVERTAQLLQLPPAAEATEADWLRQAAAINDAERAQRVVAIVRAWQFAAYAGRYPDDATIERLLSGWPVQAGA